jgi:hypothetical protein
VVDERAQRMEPKTTLERGPGLLFLRVRRHQRGAKRPCAAEAITLDQPGGRAKENRSRSPSDP